MAPGGTADGSVSGGTPEHQVNEPNVTQGSQDALPRIPPTTWTSSIHPLHKQIVPAIDGYFLEHWSFADDAARSKFVAASFSRMACFYFPEALDDRIHFVCCLMTLLFLIHDALSSMTPEEGTAYTEKLIPITRGDVLPNRNVPVEWMTYDLWASMRAHDRSLTDAIQEPAFVFMRGHTEANSQQPKNMSLGAYFEHLEADADKSLFNALMRFSMALEVSPADLNRLRPLENVCSKHHSSLGEIWYLDKELALAEKGDRKNAASGFLYGTSTIAVAILAKETGISMDAARNVLYHLCREWELKFDRQANDLLTRHDTPIIKAYVKGLRYQMSGNEVCNRTTRRHLAL